MTPNGHTVCDSSPPHPVSNDVRRQGVLSIIPRPDAPPTIHGRRKPFRSKPRTCSYDPKGWKSSLKTVDKEIQVSKFLPRILSTLMPLLWSNPQFCQSPCCLSFSYFTPPAPQQAVPWSATLSFWKLLEIQSSLWIPGHRTASVPPASPPAHLSLTAGASHHPRGPEFPTDRPRNHFRVPGTWALW